MDVRFQVANEVFARFPGYVRGVVVAHGVSNGPAPEALIHRLRAAEARVRAAIRPDNIAEQPRIRAWREAFRTMGAKPADFRPSIEALVRRVLRGEPLPSISALVDIGTVASLEHLVPAGAHAIDVVHEDLWLRPATGREEFIPLGAESVEHPLPGEIIFAEGNVVLTRRWVWRQGSHTLVRPETTAGEFNVDGLPLVPTDEVAAICNEIAAMVQEYCGGTTRQEILSAAHPVMSLAS